MPSAFPNVTGNSAEGWSESVNSSPSPPSSRDDFDDGPFADEHSPASVMKPDAEIENVNPASGSPACGLARERRPTRKSKKLSQQDVSVELALCDITSSDASRSCSEWRKETRGILQEAIDEYLLILLNPSKPPNADDARYAMKLLRKNVAAGGDDISAESLDYALAKTYDSMEKNKTDPLIQQNAIQLLGKLAREKKWFPNVVAETGGIDKIVATMSAHADSGYVQERAIIALLHLTSTERARETMIRAKGAESVCWAMRGFVENKNIQVQGSTVLCNMAFGSPSSKKRIGKIGGIDGVVKAMESHASDPDIQARCSLAIRNLTCGSRVNQWIAGRSRAVEAIMLALETFPDDVTLQYQGYVALANLCKDEPDNRVRAVDCGIIECSLKAMQKYSQHAEIAEFSLALLRNLSVGSEKNQLRIGQMGGVRDVVSCLRLHVSVIPVLTNGCEVIRHLMFARENRLAIYECGGLEVLVRVMREGISSKVLAEASIYAIGNSAYDLPESKSAIGRHGGMATLVDVMSNHLDSVAIQQHGCRALRNLADSDLENNRLLAESGAIDSCIFACSGYPENGEVQEHALAMLYNMTYSDENVRRMKGLDVERVALQACERHPEKPAVKSQGEALLELLRKAQHAQEARQAPSPLKNAKSGYLGALARKSSSPRLRDRKGRSSKVSSPNGSTKSSSSHRDLQSVPSPHASFLSSRSLGSRSRS